MIETKTEWPTRHGNTHQLIETGTVTLVFPQYETRLCKWGLILRFDSPWQGQYAPSIDSLALGLALKYNHNSGSRWQGLGVQDPAEYTVPAMPSAEVKLTL